ncbi:MAG: glycosyltransferase [Saprospiraceae bacterium]|nr:glycosyltransferase [Saprospiraceae bacterium]
MYEGIKCLVIIPTYNEIENVADIISAVLSQGTHFHVLIVDDNSPGCVHSKADFAIGSRYVKGGGISNWPKDRLFLSYGASLYVRLITGMPIKDPTAGFICYHNRVLRGLDLSKIKFSGYAFQIEMKYAAYLKGFKWNEVPIIFSDRIKGTSKMSTNIVSEAIKGVLGLRLKAFKGYYQ